MTTYIVTALDPETGITTEGKFEADNEELAKGPLSARGLTVVDVRKAGISLDSDLPFLETRVKPRDLAVFSRMFATMINAGMPMLRALTVIVDQTKNKTLRDTLRALEKDIEGGSKLSEAVAKHDEVFPPLMVAMIRAGEVGGFLDTALNEVATSIEKEVKLRSKVVSAATYPLVVMALGVIGTIGLLIFVVPTFTAMFTEMGADLPLPTQIVVNLSEFMKYAALPLLIGLMGLGVWWRRNRHAEKVRAFVDPIKLKTPVFGDLLLKIALSRFTRNLSVMLKSGVPIMDALEVVAETSGNTVVRDAVDRAAKKIQRGAQLSDHLGDGGIIPPMVVQMIAVGEESGAMDQMLAKVSDFYEEEVNAKTDQLSSLLEPFLIVGMGVGLGALVIAMYMPMFQMFEMIE